MHETLKANLAYSNSGWPCLRLRLFIEIEGKTYTCEDQIGEYTLKYKGSGKPAFMIDRYLNYMRNACIRLHKKNFPESIITEIEIPKFLYG